jgi:hypothetical protein
MDRVANGVVLPARDRAGRKGWVFRAPDGTTGPFHLQVGGPIPAYLEAQRDRQRWVARQRPQLAAKGAARSTKFPARSNIGG